MYYSCKLCVKSNFSLDFNTSGNKDLKKVGFEFFVIVVGGQIQDGGINRTLIRF